MHRRPNAAVVPTTETPQQPQERVLLSNQYNSGLCDCFDNCKICLDGWCCSACEVGYQYSKIVHSRQEMHLGTCIGLIGASGVTTLALMYVSAHGTGNPVIRVGLFWTGLYNGLHLRPTINRKYGIHESNLMSCLKGFCCITCAVCQQKREMILRGDHVDGVFYTAPRLGEDAATGAVFSGPGAPPAAPGSAEPPVLV